MSTVPSTPAASAGRPRVLAIQNDEIDPPQLVGEWLLEDGIAVQIVSAYSGAAVPAAVPEGISGILALGGVVGADEDDVAPWLVQERALLADAVAAGVPVLGLCLGAQLLAAANGGSVGRAPVAEVGVVRVQRTGDGLVDPLMSQAVAVSGSDLPAAQWHQDQVEALPEDAVLLLTNTTCRVQGFRLGSVAYGLQMHAEVTSNTFESWGVAADEALARSGRDARAAAAEMRAAEADLIRAWRPVVRAWGDLVWMHARDGAGRLTAHA